MLPVLSAISVFSVVPVLSVAERFSSASVLSVESVFSVMPVFSVSFELSSAVLFSSVSTEVFSEDSVLSFSESDLFSLSGVSTTGASTAVFSSFVSSASGCELAQEIKSSIIKTDNIEITFFIMGQLLILQRLCRHLFFQAS